MGHDPAAENYLRRNALLRRAWSPDLCSDHHCSHSIAISADPWPDHVRLSNLEPRFVGEGLWQEERRRSAELPLEREAGPGNGLSLKYSVTPPWSRAWSRLLLSANLRKSSYLDTRGERPQRRSAGERRPGAVSAGCGAGGGCKLPATHAFAFGRRDIQDVAASRSITSAASCARALTRRRDRDALQETRLIYGDFHAGTIRQSVGTVSLIGFAVHHRIKG